MKNFKISSLIDIYGALLTHRQSDILRHYYDFDLSYAEIAEIFSITRQGVGQIIETSTRQLEAFDKILNLSQIISDLEEISHATAEPNTALRLDSIVQILRSDKTQDN